MVTQRTVYEAVDGSIHNSQALAENRDSQIFQGWLSEPDQRKWFEFLRNRRS